jgi:hypothetical protein
VRSDERYDQPYERALRFAPMRALLRCCPVAMLLDDHEVSDNFERRPRGRAARRAEDEAFDTLLRRGLRAYRRYQRLDNAPPRRPGAQDWGLRFGGHPFYLLDTRSERQWAHGQRRLVDDAQWRSLEGLAEPLRRRPEVHRHALAAAAAAAPERRGRGQLAALRRLGRRAQGPGAPAGAGPGPAQHRLPVG